MLTKKLMEQTIAAIFDRDGLSFAISGELLQRGTTKFANLRDPLHDSMHLDDLQDKAVLLDHAKDSGVAPTGGSG
jgi:hypothetical protein